MYPEFLDNEWFEVRPPPIRAEDTSTIRFPTWVIKELAQKTRLTNISVTDQDILDDLRLSMRNKGILKPLVLKVDNRGRIALFDGHHRLLVAESIGLKEIPVRIEFCQSLSIESRSMKDILLTLLREKQ